MFIVVTKKRLYKVIIALLIVCLLMICIFIKCRKNTKTNGEPVGYVVLVIDDLGYHGDGMEELLKLDIPITAAVMPFSPFTKSDAEAVHKAGIEVIMHVPMEPVVGKKEWLGPKGITCDLSDEEIKLRIKEGLDEIKYAVGMNNHMGSKATQDKRVMKAILEIAKENNLFFLDSKTNPNSIVADVANELDVICFERDVFLDNIKNQRAIEKQLKKLGNIALEKGYAIGIGHVGAEGGKVTINAIKNMYPILEKEGIKFVNLSKLKRNLH
ncbi:divergent polysaccharide deacetylase family protein [Crassaminicella indica]|uniref:Divergent polysaccharide deacetylase family protein n=1 Tax=Crassaminicella indica TaxID=2855394 RepID=A0ABX8RAE9_9CLOT|nr:divergent polysaccharide deacetylase family protein [Crassaminicella indica]QXM05242.1 divergent polysaccharide deacetylase family protein [Crassaminicella indica]